jgi:protein-L-isoaspartate(D-aspartate) O-methyltransferase
MSMTEQQAFHREQSRFNMIEQQIRTWEVLDPVVLDLLKKVPREAFVPSKYEGLAFADLEIPLGEGQLMLSPKVEGRILQALAIQKTDKVLEIGTGAGYLTALMATQAKHVDSVELNSKLSQAADKRIAAQKIKNVSLHVADGLNASDKIYDVIVLTGSLPVYPEQIECQLAMGGRMFVVVGDEPAMEAILVTRVTKDAVRRDNLFETCLPPLVNAPQPSRFSF